MQGTAMQHIGLQRNLQIGSSPRSSEDNHRGKDDRGISFCDTISSSKSSYRSSSNGSLHEEDDVSSQYADNSSHESEDVTSDADSDDIADKIKWFFLNVEHQEPTSENNTSESDSNYPKTTQTETAHDANNLSEQDTNASEQNETSADSLIGKRKRRAESKSKHSGSATKHFKID
jgi:hypothetical protein